MTDGTGPQSNNRSSTRSRISAPDAEALAPDGRAVFDAAIRTFGAPLGPRIPLLHSPDVAVAWSKLGQALRKSPLKHALRELAILVVGQHWRADFEWHAHAPKAVAAGVAPALLDQLLHGQTPHFEDEEMRVVFTYCHELVHTRSVSDATYNAAMALLGERLMVDLTALLGHFTNVAMTLNAHRVQLPVGVPSPFAGVAAQTSPSVFHTGWLERDGISLRYRQRAGTGPTLVFVHELGGSLESWDACIALLPPEWPTLQCEWRGAGLSSKLLAPVSFETLVADLQHLITEKAGAGRHVVIGVAAGAATALRFAASHPAQVAALAAFVPALGTPAEHRGAVSQLAERIEREGMQAMAAMERTYPPSLREQHPARWAEYRLRHLGNDPHSYAHLLRLVAQFDLSADLPRVACPALVVGGTLDIRPVSMMQALAQQLPQGRFEELPAGHYMPAQAPDLLAQTIQRFVAGLPGTTIERA
jgi:3-oxoadipate enol-lactonase